MPQPDRHLAIAFTDIVGSSRLYSTLGNIRAKAKIDEGIASMRQVVTHYQGTVIKTIGDEIMYCHEDAEQCCNIAVQMNLVLNRLHFYLRSGIAFGPVIIDRDDLYGDTVNNAAFLARTAQSNQILLDANSFANLSLLRTQCDFFDRIPLKGQAEHSLVYRLNWEARNTASLDATVVANKALSADNGNATQLFIAYLGNSYLVDQYNSIDIGRDQAAVQLCVRHKNASRNHCSVMHHRGKFIVQDHSTNGTYVQQQGHKEIFLRREATALIADGVISIGQPCEDSDVVLHYHLD